MTDEPSAGNDFLRRVGDVLEKQIRPILQSHGGDIELVTVDSESGVVSVRLHGACQGCPGAAMTLKMGVERQLKQVVPEVTAVNAVE